MGRLLEDSNGVIWGRISSRGDINIEKLGELMGAPKHIFGKDTGQVERIWLMGYLLERGLEFAVRSMISYLCPKVNLLSTCIPFARSLPEITARKYKT